MEEQCTQDGEGQFVLILMEQYLYMRGKQLNLVILILVEELTTYALQRIHLT